MAKYNQIQQTFQQGEISNKNAFRTDAEKYHQSGEELKNGVVDYDGAFWTRPGTTFLADEITTTAGTPQLKGTEKVFPLLVTNPYTGKRTQYHAVLKRADGVDVADITMINFAYVPGSSWTYGAAQGTAATVENVSNFPTWDFPASAPLANNEGPFHHVQVGNTLFITAPHFQTTYIRTEFSTTAPYNPTFYYGPIWSNPLGDSSTANTWQKLPYYLNTNTDLGLKTSATTGTVTVDSRNAADSADKNFFVSGHVGAVFIFQSGAFVITAVTNAHTATAVVLSTLSAATITTTWSESSISDARGWPKALEYFQQRLVLAGNFSFPDTIWFSETGDVSEFYVGIGASLTATSAYDVTMDQPVPWYIQWMASNNNKLFIGTERGEHTCTQADPTSGFGSGNTSIQKESAYGSIPHQATLYENGVVFMDSTGKKVRQLIFDDLERVYQGVELTDLAEFVFDRTRDSFADDSPNIDLFNDAEIRIQKMPTFDVIWIKRAAALFSITVNRARKVMALCHHEISGTGPASIAQPLIYSMSVGRNDELNASEYPATDHMMMIVGRRINSADVYYLEQMGATFNWSDFKLDGSDMWGSSLKYRQELFASHLDCHWMESIGGAAFTVSNLDHVEGEVVYVWADGYSLGPYTVASGSIDLTGDIDSEPDTVIVGLRYKQRFASNPIEAGSQIGTNKASVTRIHQIFIQLFRTLNLAFGQKWKDTADDLESYVFPQPTNAGDPTPIFTGKLELDLRGSTTDKPNQIVLEHEGPFNACICGIVYRGQTND